jgi:hypothetical protein
LVTCWINQPESQAERGLGKEAERDRQPGYYVDAADAEAPGRWWGPGLRELGLEAGQRVEKPAYMAVYQQIHPQTGARIGRPPGSYAQFRDNLAAKLAAEPHATAARRQELAAEAHKETRTAYPYTDVTVSFSKDISLLGAGIRANLHKAAAAGDAAAEVYWRAQLERFQECLQEGNRAALDYIQEHAGVTRTGHHGTRVDGKEPGRFEPAGLVGSSWLQGTSRAGAPVRLAAWDSNA